MEISPVEGSPPINELDNPWTSIKALQCLYFLVYLWHSSHRLEYDAFRHSQFAIGWAEAFIDTAKGTATDPVAENDGVKDHITFDWNTGHVRV